MTKVTKVTKLDPLSTIITRILSNSVSNDGSQSIEEHMVKFKGRSNVNMPKTSQWVSRFGIVVPVKEDTSINFTCTWVRKKAQKKILDQVLFWKRMNPFKMSTNIYIYIFFDNFFNSLSQLVKLYERGFYGIGTAWKEKKGGVGTAWKYRKCLLTERWREMISCTCILIG